MFLSYVLTIHALRFVCKYFFFVQYCVSIIKQNVISPQHFYFNIFSLSNLSKTPLQINSCWSVQYSSAFSSLTKESPFCIWNSIFVCVHMYISLAAALLLNPLIYDSFILIIALFSLHKTENAVYFHLR